MVDDEGRGGMTSEMLVVGDKRGSLEVLEGAEYRGGTLASGLQGTEKRKEGGAVVSCTLEPHCTGDVFTQNTFPGNERPL